MDTATIIGIALGVGAVVYFLSLRRPDASATTDPLPPAPSSSFGRLEDRGASRAEELGFGRHQEPPDRPGEDSFVYVPILAAPGTDWRTRIGGVVGLLALVTVASLAVAIGMYQLGHVLNEMVRGFLGK